MRRYFPHLFEPLLVTLLQLCGSRDTRVLLGHSYRRDEFEDWRPLFQRFFTFTRPPAQNALACKIWSFVV